MEANENSWDAYGADVHRWQFTSGTHFLESNSMVFAIDVRCGVWELVPSLEGISTALVLRVPCVSWHANTILNMFSIADSDSFEIP